MKTPRLAPFDLAQIQLSAENLVEASAGTGKTYAIATLFVRLLIEKRLRPQDILVVTFTEAATAELRDRVRARTVEALQAFRSALAGEAPVDPVLAQLTLQRKRHLQNDVLHLGNALENIDEAPISTIHGFCQRVLHDNAFRTGVSFGAELITDLSELHDDVLFDFWQRSVADAPLGLARQVHELGVDLDYLRTLMKEALRNPRGRVMPGATAGATLEQRIAQAHTEFKSSSRDPGAALQFVEKSCLAKGFGGGPSRTALVEAVERCLEETDSSQIFVPANSAAVFPANLAENLTVKVKFVPVEIAEFFAAFEKLAQLCAERVTVLQHEFLSAVLHDLQERKLNARVLGFEDLLLQVANSLAGPDGDALAQTLRDRFKAVLIDEFQDTDPVQFEIFNRAFGVGDHPFFLVGDPKQAIYGFRGADVFAYLSAAEQAQRFSMQTSYRSDPGVLRAVNELFSPAGRFLIEGIEYAGVSAAPLAQNVFDAPYLTGTAQNASLEILLVKRPLDADQDDLLSKPFARAAAARVVAADIARLCSERATLGTGQHKRVVTAADIAVLARTNEQCLRVQVALRERGIPAVVMGASSVFESDDAAQLQAVLGAVCNPRSRKDLRRALTTGLLGISGDQIAAHEADVAFWQQWVSKFQIWHDLWLSRGFMRMFRALLAGAQVAEKLLQHADGERSLTNLMHLAELLHRASVEHQLGPVALLTWLVEQINQIGEMADQAEIRLESDEAAVQIMTVHKSKGLEFPIVYCPFLWDGKQQKKTTLPLRFHDDQGRATLDIQLNAKAREGNLRRAAWESFAEEARVIYVALTRAKHRTTVVWGAFNGLRESVAAFLLHNVKAPKKFDLPLGLDAKSVSDEALCDLLADYVARCEGATALRQVPWEYDAVAPATAVEHGEPLTALRVSHAIESWRRTGSFSSLTAHDSSWQTDEEAAKDRDRRSSADTANLDASARSAGGRGVDPGAPITLLGFPRGANVGNLFHEIFEEIDFVSITDEALGQLCESKLQAYGLGANPTELTERRALAVRAVRETLQATLESGFCLGNIASHKKLAELALRMPVGSSQVGLTAEALARVFRDHPSSAVPTGYSRRLEHLGFQELRGFLVGFVDLVFEHEGRWYVVDYKTNHLGDAVNDYSTAAMTRAMEESHYFLQYHIYALGLDRYLKHMLPKYNYEQHFGGVMYLFIKGLHPKALPGSGVFFEKPPQSRLQALSYLLAGAPLAGAGQGVQAAPEVRA